MLPRDAQLFSAAPHGFGSFFSLLENERGKLGPNIYFYWLHCLFGILLWRDK
jgi:hypothetical protein